MNFQMINVAEKAITNRRAVAEGRFFAAPETIMRIKEKTLPKGDPLPLAEAAGIMAAKKTSDTLPLCHPLSLDAVRVECIVEAKSVLVRCEAIAHAKTGVEMEALNGAMAALLCIYDLTKGIDPALEIGGVFLRTKEGGKSGNWTHPKLSESSIDRESPTSAVKQTPSAVSELPAQEVTSYSGIQCAILTMSDRCSKGLAVDESGPLIQNFLKERQAVILDARVIPDDKTIIKQNILEVAKTGAKLIVMTGGTGVGPRDVTPEAVTELGAHWIPGFGEHLRHTGAAEAPNAWLSRGGAAVLKSTLIILLPGSPKGVRHGLEKLEKLAKHALRMIEGEGHS